MPGVGHYVASTPSALGQPYRDKKPLASSYNLTGLVAPSYRRASEASGFHIVVALGRWWLPSEMRRSHLV